MWTGISLSEYKGNTIFQANTLLCHSKTKFRSQNLVTVCFICDTGHLIKRGLTKSKETFISSVETTKYIDTRAEILLRVNKIYYNMVWAIFILF